VEKALRRSEEKFRSLVEITSDWVWEVDPTGTYTYASPKVRDLLGYEPEEVLGRKPFDFMPPFERERIIQTLREAVEAKAPLNALENINIHKNGQWVYLETSAVPILDADGNFLGYHGIDRDITKRKRSEAALAESEKRFSEFMKHLPAGVFIKDSSGRLVFANRFLEELFGWHDCVGKTAVELLPPELAERMIADDRQVLTEGPMVIQERVTDIQGAEHFFHTYKFPIEVEGSDVLLAGITVDITERKRAEEALIRSEALLSKSQAIGHIGSWELNLGADQLTWSDEAYRIFGLRPQEFEATYEAFLEVVHPEDREAVNAILSDSVREGRDSYEIEHRIIRRDNGEVRFVLEKCEHIKDASGSVVRSVGLVQDITERKHAEEERRKLDARMRETQKLESLGVLAGGIAHEFNNLLTAILGNADLALFSLSPVSPACQYIGDIKQASHRAAELCRQMLAYSGKGHFVVGRYNISEIIREMGPILNVSVSKKAAIRYSLAEDLPAVESDANQIRQIIMNLITNASDALGDRQGVIAVTTGVAECDAACLTDSYLDDNLPGGTYVFIEVSDTGCGMDAETQSRLFDPFFSTKFTGRGLGLPAVLGIVRSHKGAIKLHSEVGRGTTIRILLPAVESEPGARARTAVEGPSPQSGPTILFVDDDPQVRGVASEMLAKLGFQVVTATNGREGLEFFSSHRDEIVCVILDLSMPEMDGEEAFRELRYLSSDARVILSSGYNEQEVSGQFAGRGLAGFIQKPYTMTNLRHALKRALG